MNSPSVRDSNHCLIIWMPLRYLKLRAFVKCQKREGKTYGFGAIWDLFCTGEEYFHHCVTGDRWQSEEWEKTKKCSNCRKHICLLSQLAYSSIICLVKWIFQLRRQADTGPHVQGKSSVNIFFSTREMQSGLRNKSPSLQVKRVLCDTASECNKLIFGKAIWQWGKSTAHSHLDTLLSGKMV